MGTVSAIRRVVLISIYNTRGFSCSVFRISVIVSLKACATATAATNPLQHHGLVEYVVKGGQPARVKSFNTSKNFITL